MEQGISICLTKKLLSLIGQGYKSGHSLYNSYIKKGIKKYYERLDMERKREIEKDAKKIKAAKIAKKKLKKKEKLREEQIELQKEAYVRAIRELENKE